MERPKIPANSISELERLDIDIPDNFDFHSPNITLPKRIIFNGKPFDLKVENSSFQHENSSVAEITFSTATASIEYGVVLALTITEIGEGRYKATTYITNRDRSVPGLGRALWEMSLKLIQKLAEAKKVFIIHEVMKAPNFDLSNMNPNQEDRKWDELFVPLLEKHGYIRKNEKHWDKVYGFMGK